MTDKSDRMKIRFLAEKMGEEINETNHFLEAFGRRFWFKVKDEVEYISSIDNIITVE